MTKSEIRKHVESINALSQMEMAGLWRNAPIGHPYFDKKLPLFAVFEKRFKELGGMTPAVSKAIGWESSLIAQHLP